MSSSRENVWVNGSPASSFLFLNNLVIGNFLTETSRKLNMHIDSGLACCHLCQAEGVFAQPQEQSWNRNATDTQELDWFSPSVFSHLLSPDTCNISIPHTQGKLLLIPLYSYTQLWSFPLKKRGMSPVQVFAYFIVIAITNKSHNLQTLNKRFWSQLLCLLETLNLADNKHPDCLWEIQFWLCKNTLPNCGFFLSHIRILLG